MNKGLLLLAVLLWPGVQSVSLAEGASHVVVNSTVIVIVSDDAQVDQRKQGEMSNLPDKAMGLDLWEGKQVEEGYFDVYFVWLKYWYEYENAELPKAKKDAKALSYVKAFEKRLLGIEKNRKSVPLVTLLDEKGNVIKNAEQSRKYLISQGYSRITDFIGETMENPDLAARYGRRGMKISAYNPDLIFLTAYYEDDGAWGISANERVIRLTQVSEHLLYRDLGAVYTNLGYTIWKESDYPKYPQAIEYLKRAYFHSDYEHAIALAARIFLEQGREADAFEAMKYEALAFFSLSAEDLEYKDGSYWLVVRTLIEMAEQFDDTEAAYYFCNKYLEFWDAEYEDCLDLDERVGSAAKKTLVGGLVSALLPKNKKHSFWRLKEELEATRKMQQQEEAQATNTLASVVLSKEDYKQYNAYRKEMLKDTAVFVEKHKELKFDPVSSSALLESPENASLLLLYMENRGYIARLDLVMDMCAADDGMMDFVSASLLAHFQDQIKEDFYVDFKARYDFDSEESCSYLYDMLSIFAYELSKKGYVLVNMDVEGDYIPLILRKDQFEQVKFLATRTWRISPHAKHMVFPLKGGERFVR